MNSIYELTSEQNNFIIKVSKKSIDEKILERFLDFIELEAIRQRSELTMQDAESLAFEIKQSAWHRVKNIFKK